MGRVQCAVAWIPLLFVRFCPAAARRLVLPGFAVLQESPVQQDDFSSEVVTPRSANQDEIVRLTILPLSDLDDGHGVTEVLVVVGVGGALAGDEIHPVADVLGKDLALPIPAADGADVEPVLRGDG